MGHPERALLGEAGYELSAEIGRGASGVVYRALQLSLDRVVALKRVAAGGAADSAATHRLEVEIAALTRLEHPLVVRVFDVLSLPEAVWIVMEHVDGPTLSTVLESRGRLLDPPDALAVIEALARGLSQVARAGIVHRDVKPANVFLTRDGRVKLGDFGIASLRSSLGPASSVPRSLGPRSDDAATSTRPGTILGTPAYLAPEQAAGSSEVDSRADLYSLGVIAFELFSGRVPFPDRGNLFAMLAAHQSAAVPRLRDICPDLPPEIESVVRQALGKLAGERQEGVEAFWTELDRAATRAWPSWREASDLAGLALACFLVPPLQPKAAATQPPGMGVDDATLAPQEDLGSTLLGSPVITDPKPRAATSKDFELSQSPRRPRAVKRRSAGARRMRTGLALLVVLAFAVAGYSLVGVLLKAPAPGLSVGAISVGVAGSCTSGAREATATLRTNGVSGVVESRWGENGRGFGPIARTPVAVGDGYVQLHLHLGSFARAAPLVVSSVTFYLLSPGPPRSSARSIRPHC